MEWVVHANKETMLAVQRPHRARNAELERLREVLESADRRRIPLATAAYAVWDAYTALGSPEGLTGEDVRDVARFLTAHAIAEQGKLRRGPKDRTEAQRGTAKLVDEANVRTRRLLVDAARKGGIAINEKAVVWFIQVNDRLLVSYAACKELMATSEDLEGYPRRQTSVADLAVPLWALNKDDQAIRSRSAKRDALDPLEVDPDPEAALRAAILSGPDLGITDLCAPGMPQGSVTPVRKVLQLLSFAAARHRQGQRGIVDTYTCAAAAEAAKAWNHPRLARAVVEVLLGDPFGVSPNAALFNILLAEASDGRDSEAGDELLARMRRLRLEPHLDMFNTMIRFYARTGRLGLARDTLKEMVAAGHKQDEVTGLALLEGILTAETTVEDVIRTMDLLAEARIAVTFKHWNKALRHFADQGDLQSMERIWNDLPVAPNETTVATCANAYEKFGSADQLLTFLDGAPRQLLSTSETWSAAIRAFARRWTVSRDEEFGDLAFALCCAVLDRVPIDAAALPLGKRDLPLAGMSPPRPMPGLLLVVFEGMRTRFEGDRLRILEEKGRAYLVSEGHSVGPDMDAKGMHEMLDRSFGNHRRSGPG
ncbi:hypothetical protein DFJ74DRAFT_768717 [Hyaloraphidium curvatum]|nr:hypothetical protein DFJ74DRAFT_768717 [Hyaloraphidium curvatum]